MCWRARIKSSSERTTRSTDANLKERCGMKKAVAASILVAIVLLALGVIAEAQQPAKIPRIGFLPGSSDANNARPRIQSFRGGLRDLGYVEGKNILVEDRYIEK